MLNTKSTILVAIDIKRKRVFVLYVPQLIAVKRDDVWHYGENISDEEIEKHYKLITDIKLAQTWIDEAKAELNITF